MFAVPKVSHKFSATTKELIHTDSLFITLSRSWLELLFLSKMLVVSEPLVQCAATYIISDMLDTN